MLESENIMDNDKRIPLSAINSGRPLEKVLEKYMSAFTDCKKRCVKSGMQDDEATARSMTAAVYRVYVMGVEDGMNAMREEKNE